MVRTPFRRFMAYQRLAVRRDIQMRNRTARAQWNAENARQ